LNAEAEEREGGFGEDRAGQAEGGHHDHGVDDVREDVQDDDARGAGAEGFRGGDVLHLAHFQDLAAHEARVTDPSDRRQREDDVVEARPEDRHESDGEEDAGEGEEDVGDAHDERVEPAAEVASHGAEGDADQRGEDDDAEADAQRDARPPEDARENVAPEIIEAEEMAVRRRFEAADGVLRIRIERRQQRRGDRDEHERHGQQQAGGEGEVF